MSKESKKKQRQAAKTKVSQATKSFDHTKIKNPTDYLLGKILIIILGLGMVGASIVAIIYAIINTATHI